MGKTFYPYYVGQNPRKKTFTPWYRPGSEARKKQEEAARRADDDNEYDDDDPIVVGMDEAGDDETGLVVQPLDNLDLVKTISSGKKQFRSVTLEEMRARRNNVRSVSREEIMRPAVTRPYFRAGDPRAVGYFRATGDEIAPPIGGLYELYPSWYHGLVRRTYIRITTRCDDDDTRLRVIIGPTEYCRRIVFDNLKSNEDHDFGGHYRYEVAKLHLFKNGEETNRIKGKYYHQIIGDAFDLVTVEVVQKNRTVRLRRIEIVLNGITILNKDYDNIHIRKVILDSEIAKRRQEYVDSDNPIIRVAATQIGKSWCPRYGNRWNWDLNSGNAGKPVWCSEFAAWALQNGTNGRIIIDDANKYTVKGLIYHFFKNEGYITSKFDEYAFPAYPNNVIVKRFDHLTNTIKSGYYIPIGLDENKDGIGDHSGLFVKWEPGPFPDRFKMMRTIEGNSGDIVQVNVQCACLNRSVMSEPPAILWDCSRKLYYHGDDGHLENAKYVYDGFGKAY